MMYNIVEFKRKYASCITVLTNEHIIKVQEKVYLVERTADNHNTKAYRISKSDN